MVNDADTAWTSLSRFNVRFDESVPKMQLYANGKMQLKIVVEILATDVNGDPVLLSENQLLFLRLVDADNNDSNDLGNGWSFTVEENRFNHSLSAVASYYSSSGDSGSHRQGQTRVLWVSTTQTGSKKIGATIVSTTSMKTFSSMDIGESTVVCEGIKEITYNPDALKCEVEEQKSGKYIDFSVLVESFAGPDPRRIEKEWYHNNIYIKTVSGLHLAQATYHYEAEDGRKLDLEQDTAVLLTPTGDWNGDKPEVKKDVYEREINSKFPLIPLKYDQHDNDLHLFDLWYFVAPEAFRDDQELPPGLNVSYQGPTTVGAVVTYRRPFSINIPGNQDDDIDNQYRDHKLYTFADITGNGQAGTVCVSHVWFKHVNSAQAYRDINYLLENKLWIDFVDEFGNSGAFGLLIQDDKVKLTSHLLT